MMFAMKRMQYAIYPPAEPGLPWLAVLIARGKPMDVFGCPDEASAERVLSEMKARTEAKNGAALEPAGIAGP